MNKVLAETDAKYENEVSRGDQLQAQVIELEKKLAEAEFPAPGDGQLPLDGKGKGK